MQKEKTDGMNANYVKLNELVSVRMFLDPTAIHEFSKIPFMG